MAADSPNSLFFSLFPENGRLTPTARLAAHLPAVHGSVAPAPERSAVRPQAVLAKFHAREIRGPDHTMRTPLPELNTAFSNRT